MGRGQGDTVRATVTDDVPHAVDACRAWRNAQNCSCRYSLLLVSDVPLMLHPARSHHLTRPTPAGGSAQHTQNSHSHAHSKRLEA